MVIGFLPAAKLFTAGLLAAAALAAPAANAEPLPNPDPVPVPAPVQQYDSGGGECQAGLVLEDGNCVPAMASAGTDDVGGPITEAPITGTQAQTSTTESGLGENLVPNINGYPCTGGWESAACYAMGQDNMPAVEPRSTLSSSP